MHAAELTRRLKDADAYLEKGVARCDYRIIADAIRIRCRILCEAGDPKYQVWKGDR